LNTAQILGFKFIYGYVSSALNNFENHRTETEFEDGMISKLTMFTFVNSYASFFYIAFIAPYQTVGDGTQCGTEGCMSMLSTNLLIIIVCSLTSDKLVEFGIPVVMNLSKIPTKIWKVLTCAKDILEEGPLTDEQAAKKEYNMSVYDFSSRLGDFTTLFTIVSLHDRILDLNFLSC